MVPEACARCCDGRLVGTHTATGHRPEILLVVEEFQPPPRGFYCAGDGGARLNSVTTTPSSRASPFSPTDDLSKSKVHHDEPGPKRFGPAHEPDRCIHPVLRRYGREVLAARVCAQRHRAKTPNLDIGKVEFQRQFGAVAFGTGRSLEQDREVFRGPARFSPFDAVKAIQQLSRLRRIGHIHTARGAGIRSSGDKGQTIRLRRRRFCQKVLPSKCRVSPYPSRARRSAQCCFSASTL